MTTIDIGNWVRVSTKHCKMPKCYNCDSVPRHHEFDGQKGILEHDFQIDLDCEASGRAHPIRPWSFDDRALCKACGHGRVTIREEMEAFRHTLAVCFDGVHSRFHSDELEDMGPNLGDNLEEQIREALSRPVPTFAIGTTQGTPVPEFEPIQNGPKCYCAECRSDRG